MAGHSVVESDLMPITEPRLDKPIQIVIPFQSLLLQITEHLHFPAPKYKLIDVETNNAAVLVCPDSGPGVYTFIGCPCASIEKSCQKAAQNVVRDFMVRFSVWVEDISVSKRREIERCSALYKLKRQEIRYLKKGLVGIPLIEKLGRGAPVGSVPVIVDFTAILRLIIRKCEIYSSKIETISHGNSKYTAWITISYPAPRRGSKTFYSSRCDCLEDARNSLAKTVIEYLIPIYNLEIIDANFNPTLTAYAAVLSALEMESYLSAKERLLGMEVMSATPRLLPVKCNSKLSNPDPKAPTIISRPVPPKQRPFKSTSMLMSVKNKIKSGDRKKFNIPGELTTVFKRKKQTYSD